MRQTGKLSGRELQKLLNTPLNCIHCHCLLNQRRDGYYQCPVCDTLYKDNLAIAKEFIFNNPDTTFEELLEGTKLPEETLLYFIEHKMIIFPDSNKNFTSCKTCGRLIIKGRYCNNCALITFNRIKANFDGEE